MHRSDLLEILLTGCAGAGAGLETDEQVTELRDDGGRVHATCADGRTFTGVAAIGADGLRSYTRTLFSDDEPICSGYVAYRGAVPWIRSPATPTCATSSRGSGPACT
jgi:salicylate hydroxylase